MQRAIAGSIGVVALAGIVCACNGCSFVADPNAAIAKEFLLPQEPAGGLGVIEARAAVKPDQELIIVGKIGGVPQPWDEGRASFVIVDPNAGAHDHEHDHDHAHDKQPADDKAPAGEKTADAGKPKKHDHDHAHGHDHSGHDHGDHHDCPFCEKLEKDSKTLAVVQFLGKDGKIVPADAREVLGLKKNQTVVVRGKPVVDERGNLIVTATGLYVRP